MDYELMMNGTVKIGQMAPDFEAETTYGNISLQDYTGKWLYDPAIEDLEILE